MEPTLELLTLFAEPISDGRRQLHDGITTLRNECLHFPTDPATVETLLVNHLLTRLRVMAHRTLALEMQVARFEGHLDGNTPAARYQSFIDRLSQPEIASAILAEYPVLARQVSICIDQWVRFSLNFLRHLCIDWPQLRNVFSLPPDVGNLNELSGDSGDRHCDGKAVIVLRFASGTRLVYKPRSLAVEQRFQELLSWCNDRGSHPPFRTLQVLDRADHGWVEFVEQQDCSTVEELQRFYRRQGNYLALLYITGATDFHFENLIAAGEHPILVDLETLLHPRLPGSSKDPALQGMWNSAVSIGLLPRVSYFEGFDKGLDFSGLGAAVGQEIESPTYRFESLGTDEMRLVRVDRHMLAGSHRPTFRGVDIEPAAYGSEMLQGFIEMYELCERHRDALAAAEGPLAAFAEVETRFIARATQIYAILLEQSFHPDHLRDDLDRDRWFNQLWSQAEEATGLKPLVAAERADLDRNDIPLFHSRPGSADLWTSRGERLTNFFDRAPLESARERLADLGPGDLARQTWLVRAAVAKLTPPIAQRGRDSVSRPKFSQGECPIRETESRSLRAAAKSIGEQLAALAWQDDDEAGWLGIHRRGQGWFVGALDLDVETGLPGVALFLAELVAATGDNRFTPLLRKTIAAINRRLLVADAIKDRERLQKSADQIAQAVAFQNDPVLQAEIQRMSELVYQSTLDRRSTNSETDEALGVSTQHPPQDLEIPGLAGGLAGRGLELLRNAMAASQKTA